MLLLKGPVRKSIICQSIMEGKEPVFGIQYCSFIDLVPTLSCTFVNSDYNSQKDIGNSLFTGDSLFEIDKYRIILIYTNKKEEELTELKEIIEQFEKETNKTVVLACK